jgi:hypothetical protein
VDIALREILHPFADPARIYEIAEPFAMHMEALESASPLALSLPPTPQCGDLAPTQRALTSAIQSYRLPAYYERHLMRLADEIVQLARTAKPEDEDDFLCVLSDFVRTVKFLQHNYLGVTQVNHLLGLVFFGAPAAAGTCWIPITWKGQIIVAVVIVVGVAIIGGVRWIYTSAQVYNAKTDITAYIEECTHTTTELLRKVAKILEDKNLNDDQKKELKQGLTLERDRLPNRPDLNSQEKARLKRKYDRAISLLD